jgi:[acyl-carrier-protein] S-malonyltransferase
VIAVLAPGQGAQTPGMLTPWLELPGVTDQVGHLGELIGLDLIALGTTAGAEEIQDTAVTQPLIVTLGLVAAAQLGLAEHGVDASSALVLAGHSIGEITAAGVAGVLSTDQAVALAARRGAEMAAACALAPSGMSAVLGGDASTVVEAIEALGLTPANRNAAGQIVAAGAVEALAELAQNPPAGSRVRPLAVAGAFHTSYMATAQDALKAYVDGVPAAAPRHLLLSNSDGTSVASGDDFLARMVAQITRPVRWDLCQATLVQLGVTAVIELPPSGALVGMAKREMPGLQLKAIKSPDDLADARELIQSHFQHGQGDYTPEFQVVAAPVKGIFTRTPDIAEGQAIARGTVLGVVRTNRDEHPVQAPKAGVLIEWLRHDGDIVGADLPVARIHSGSEL